MSAKVIHKILVPLELVEETPPEVDYAIDLAVQLDAELILVAVIDTAAAASMIRRMKMKHDRAEGFNEMLVTEAKAVLQEFVDQAVDRGVKAWGHATVSEEVEAQILKEAIMQKVDLILVRSHGRSGLSRALLGSTAGEILKAAPCPVLVARA
jgi:nucleotide-binding universal stress UspA family protein